MMVGGGGVEERYDGCRNMQDGRNGSVGKRV